MLLVTWINHPVNKKHLQNVTEIMNSTGLSWKPRRLGPADTNKRPRNIKVSKLKNKNKNTKNRKWKT